MMGVTPASGPAVTPAAGVVRPIGPMGLLRADWAPALTLAAPIPARSCYGAGQWR